MKMKLFTVLIFAATAFIASLEGILETKASHKEASVQVKFNSSIVSLEAITEAINKTGYKVINSKTRE